MQYLDKIESPIDLKKLGPEQLTDVCQDIRDFMEEVVFETGGHLSSNLGVVELTVALHYSFDLLNDKVIFDVSHQCYPHKILTGRKDNFHTLRQYKGLSGFTNTNESDYDNFIFGHAGTSISTALGIASGKRMKGESGKAIAVIGDASIGAGMSFEALNHAGHIDEDVIVILNDNGMSISESVGSLSTYLTKIRVSELYQEMKKDVHGILKRIPALGETVIDSVDHIAESVRHHIGTGRVFEDLGFNYFGPIDGHDIPLLLHTFETIKEIKGPILLHVQTEKGRGHHEASSDPEKFHGVSPSKKQTVTAKQETISYTEAFSKSMIELAKEDDKLVGITAAMPGGTGLNKFAAEQPDRYFDVGICEQHALGLAAGQSVIGMKPVVAIYSTFIQRAYDQVFQELCLNKNHVIMALDRAGIVGQDGATHAGVFDIAFLRCFPDIVIMSPRSSYELKEMLRFSLGLDCPVAIRYPRDNCKQPFDSTGFKEIELGKGEILRKGDDIILCGYGTMVNTCTAVADKLKESGINATVVNPRFVKPLDKELFEELLNKNKPIITLEDHSVKGGFGSAVLELANELGKDSRNIHIMGIPDDFVEHGSRAQILKDLWLDEEGIVEYIQSHVLANKLTYQAV